MKTSEFGVLKKSDLYFSSPSPTAEKLYFYPISAGHFFCEKNYHLVRENYNSMLITHIIKGEFTFILNGSHITAYEGETAIINCYQPHEYYTNSSFESVWLHVAGQNCVDLCKNITSQDGSVIRGNDPDRIQKMMMRIYKSIAKDDKPSEMKMSLDIYTLLAELASPTLTSNRKFLNYEDSISQVKEYIIEHISDTLSVRKLAATVHMSPSHFSRIFKQHTGFSPYDYILVTRLNKAKEYLQKTEMPISAIAFETGFNSESNFIFFFTTNTGISPNKFRKMKF